MYILFELKFTILNKNSFYDMYMEQGKENWTEKFFPISQITNK